MGGWEGGEKKVLGSRKPIVLLYVEAGVSVSVVDGWVERETDMRTVAKHTEPPNRPKAKSVSSTQSGGAAAPNSTGRSAILLPCLCGVCVGGGW